MAFRNLTPLPCLPFELQLPEGGRQQVVIVKLTLELEVAGEDLRAGGFTHRLALAPEQQPLRFTDVEPGPWPDPCLRLESELTPGKPRCDLILLGSAYPPGDRPARSFPVTLRLLTQGRRRPGPRHTRLAPPGMDLVPGQTRPSWAGVAWAEPNPRPGEELVHKRLRVTGERWLKRRSWLARALGSALRLATLGLVRPCPWKLTRPGAAADLPLGAAFSFGGKVQVEAGSATSARVPKQGRRAGSAQAWEPNPAGRGYAPAWYLRVARVRRLPAPQLEDPLHPFTAKAGWSAMVGRLRGPVPPELAPQGLDAQPRSTAVRLRHAGTWDAAWAEAGAPYPPDFSPAFWNCAHPDLQCRLLEGDEILELTNLCPPGAPGAGRDAQGNTVLRFALPGLFPYVLITRADGELVPAPALLDTVILEPAAGRVTCLQRACFPVADGARDLALLLILPEDPRWIPIRDPGSPP